MSKKPKPATSVKQSPTYKPSPFFHPSPWFTGIATTIAMGLLLDYAIAPRLLPLPVVGEVVFRLCRVTNANCGRSSQAVDKAPAQQPGIAPAKPSPTPAEPTTPAPVVVSPQPENTAPGPELEHLLAIAPQFEAVQPFSSGLAAVKIDGQWGFIDRAGTTVIPAQFDQVSDFVAGQADVSVNGEWKTIDRSGTIVTSPTVPVVNPEQSIPDPEGLKAIRVNGKWGFVDDAGEAVIPPQFEQVQDYSEGLAAVAIDGKWGFIRNPLKI